MAQWMGQIGGVIYYWTIRYGLSFGDLGGVMTMSMRRAGQEKEPTQGCA